MQSPGTGGTGDNTVAVSESSALQGFTGVSWDPQCRSYIARVFWAGKHRHIGRFTDPVTAARAFDKASVYLYGERCVTNFGVEAALQDPTEVSECIVKTRKAVGGQTAANRQNGSVPSHAQGSSRAAGVQPRSSTPGLEPLSAAAAAAAAAAQRHRVAAGHTMQQHAQQQHCWVPSAVGGLGPGPAQSTAAVLVHPTALQLQAQQQQLLIMQQQQQHQHQQQTLLAQGQHPAQHAGFLQGYTSNKHPSVAVVAMQHIGCHSSSEQYAQHGPSNVLLHPQQQLLPVPPAAAAAAATAGVRPSSQGVYLQQHATVLSTIDCESFAAMQLQAQVPSSYVQAAPTHPPLLPLPAPPVSLRLPVIHLPYAMAASATATGLYDSTALQQFQPTLELLPVQGGLACPEVVLVPIQQQQQQQAQPQLHLQVQLQPSPGQYQY